jgi:hypothetical protein
MILTRDEDTEDGVFGTLLLPDGSALCTMEDDWRGNAPRESCIVAGTYLLHRTIYHKHGYETFEVTGVPGRSRILIHPANTEEDVEGCIGLGTRRGMLRVADEDTPGHPLRWKRAVVNSRAAFDQFMALLDGSDEAVLQVLWAPGLPRPTV